MRVGVLTGGGDCPGLNAVIRAVVRKGIEVHGWDFVGFRNGWNGPLTGDSRWRRGARRLSAAGAHGGQCGTSDSPVSQDIRVVEHGSQDGASRV